MATPNIVPRADSEGGIGTSSKYWASAYIDLIYVGAGKVGRDADNYLDFSTDNEIQFRVNGNHEIIFNANQIHPTSDDGIALGYAGRGFSDLFLASGAVINFDSGNFTLTHSTDALAIADGMQFRIGSGNDLRLYHSTDSYISNEGNGHLNIRNLVDDADVILSCDDGSGGSTAYITLDGSTNRVNFAKPIKMADDIAINLGAGLDLRIFHESGSTSKIENYTGNLTIQQRADDASIAFQCDDGSGGLTEYFKIDGNAQNMLASKNIRFLDGKSVKLGTAGNHAIFFNGTNTFFDNYTGDFYLRQNSDDKDIIFQGDDGAGSLATYFYLDGSSATHDGSATTALYTNWPDFSRISLGTSHDMLMYHDSSQTVFQNKVGNFYITQAADDLDIIFQCDDGSGGTTAYLTLDGGLGHTTAQKAIKFLDDTSAYFGNSQDLEIVHTSNHSNMFNNTGNLTIANRTDDGDVIFQSDDGSGGVETYFFLDGSESVVNFPDDKRLTFGTDRDLFLYHTGSEAQMKNYTGQLTFTQEVNDGDIVFKSDDGSGGTTEYFRLDGSQADGTFKYTVFPDSSMISMGNSNDLVIGHNATNSSIINYNGNLEISNAADDQDIIFSCDDGSGGTETYFFLDSSANGSNPLTVFPDNSNLGFGSASADAYIHYNGTNFNIDNYNGAFYLTQYADDMDLIFRSDNGSGGVMDYLKLDGSIVSLVAGVDLLMALDGDGGKIKLGASQDLQIYHDGSNSYIRQDGTGDLIIQTLVDDRDIIFGSDDGSGGTANYMAIDGSIARVNFYKNTLHGDGVQAAWGSNVDLRVEHDGTDSTITNTEGNLNFYQNADDGDIRFYNDNGSGGTTEYFRLDGGDSSTQIKTIKVLMPNLPTSDPSTAGQLWNDSGTLKISAG